MATQIWAPVQLTTPRSATLAGNASPTVVAFTNIDLMVVEYVDAADGKFYGQVAVPANLAATPNASLAMYLSTPAAGSDTRWQVSTVPLADTEDLDSALTAETATTETLTGGNAIDLVTVSLTPTLVAKDLLLCEFFRDGDNAADTVTDVVRLVAAFLQVDVE